MDFVDSLKNIKEEMIKEASASQKEHIEDNKAKEERLRNEFFELVKDSNIKRK